MRNLKRMLSLALALVMVLGMMVITTSAATFTDADEITYSEAVDVMSAIGVIDGNPDGTFNPTDTLTREQGAKIVCYLLMGKDAAEKLVGSGNFTDVAATRWSAGAIDYCAALNILDGNGDGTFNPTGKLTAVQFGKMLLCALGYDADIEGYVGKNWAVNIASDMVDVGLDVYGVAMDAQLTREQAAEMTLYALQSNMVKYATKGTSITVNGMDIVTGASAAEAITTDDTTEYVSLVDEIAGGAAKNTLQFAEKYYPTLYTDWTPVNGQLGYTWKVVGKPAPISDFIVCESVLATSTDGTAIYHAAQPCLTRKDSTNPKFKAELESGFEAYLNGTKLTTPAAGDTITVGELYMISGTVKEIVVSGVYGTSGGAVNYTPGKGVKVELINTDRDAKAEKIYFTTYYVDVVNKAPVTKTNTVDEKDYLYIDMVGTDIGISAVVGSGAVKASDVEGYEGLAKNDVVLITSMADTGITIEKLTAEVGKVSAVSGSTYTIGGAEKDTAADAHSTLATVIGANIQKDTEYFYDNYGYLVYANAITADSTDYLLVAEKGAFSDTIAATGTNVIRAVFADGTKKVVTVNAVGTKTWGKGLATGDVTVDGIYAYTVNEDGSYNLITKVTVDSGSTDATVKKGVAAIDSLAGTDILADDNTVFVVYNSTPQTYSVYTGYKNVPSLNSVTYHAYNGIGGYADIVYAVANTPVLATAYDTIYLLDDTFTTYYKPNGMVDYYTAPAIVAGAKTDVKFGSDDLTAYADPSNTDGLGNGGTAAKKTLLSVVYTDGVLEANSLTTLAASSGIVEVASQYIKAPANGVVEIADDAAGTNKVVYNYAEDCVVYVIEANGKVVTVTDMSGYIEGTYTVTGVTAAYGKWATATDAEKVTLTEIYLQK